MTQADVIVANDTKLDKEYLNQGGHEQFAALAAELIYGPNCQALKAGRVSYRLTFVGFLYLSLTHQHWIHSPPLCCSSVYTSQEIVILIPYLSFVQVAVAQTLSGTGSLRVAGEFFHKFFPKAQLYYSNPTWGNSALQ
jgi:aspartate/tyrosine/aromatic aminotransferase